MFLAINAQRLVATPPDATLSMLTVAAGEVTEAQFADWIRQHTVPR